MKQNTKDWIQYSSAIALIVSAITLVFTSFAAINDVTAGVNAYIGIALSCALAIFGVSAYMVSQVASFKAEVREQLREQLHPYGSPDKPDKPDSPETPESPEYPETPESPGHPSPHHPHQAH